MDNSKDSSGGGGGDIRFLASMQEQISRGKHTDMVIRVRVRGHDDTADATAPKRRRTSQVGAGIDAYTDIPALSAILCVRSEYFEKALSGDWVESKERRVELVVHDEQELEDLKLLLKLSCTPDYTRDGGKLLPFDVRVRMAVVADSFVFAEAVDQIIASLPLDADFEHAVAFVDGRLLPTLEHHPGIAKARKGMYGALTRGITMSQFGPGNQEERSAAAAAGVTALAKCLGPIGGLIQAMDSANSISRLLASVEVENIISEKIKLFLPFSIFKLLLSSDALQLTSENEAYTLLTAWLGPLSSDQEEKFKELAPLLRYHHMSPDFLATIVSQCPYMKSSGLLHAVVRASSAQRNGSRGGNT